MAARSCVGPPKVVRRRFGSAPSSWISWSVLQNAETVSSICYHANSVCSSTRTMLLEEVWNYKFVPQTNLVDVHMGRLRHKVDGPHEAPMIHSVRGVGFILRAPA